MSSKNILVVLCLLLLAAGCSSPAPTTTTEPAAAPPHPPGEAIALRWEVLTNDVAGGGFRSALTLVNNGDVALGSEGWTLYFNFLRTIAPESLPPSVQVTHVNGDFYKLEPTDRFAPLAPGEERTIDFVANAWAIKEVDAPAGFYFVFAEEAGQVSAPQPVAKLTIRPFVREEQTSRGPNDAVPVPTPERRYRANAALAPLPEAEVLLIVPSPVAVEPGEGAVTLRPGLTIRYADGLAAEAEFLADALAPLLDARPVVEQGATGGPNTITLRRGDVTVPEARRGESDEAYRLVVEPGAGITVTGAGAAGVFYGIQSLRALLPVEAHRAPQQAIPVEAVRITDAPRFGYRGLHLDVARNFQTVEAVKALLDVMALYKLNTFHFHLTDDEGWRLAIDGLPALTEVGGRRGHTLTEAEHLIPSYGSGPDPDPQASHGSGYYTREAFIDILQYAHRRHIEVIPEIDVPGHARAAIVAMEARYDRLMAEGRPEAARRYRLVDPEDASTYRSVQGWDDNVINVCRPSTYRFLETVIDDIAEMYEEAGAPLTTIHTGGDEVPHGAWEASPMCNRLIERSDTLESIGDLPDYFLRRLSGMISERGLVTGGWQEVALEERSRNGQAVVVPDPDFVGQNVRPYVWANIWGSGTEDYAYRLANAGYPVVMSHATNFYFDMAYNKHPEEAGYYWAAFVDARDPYAFVPFDLYKNAETDRMGHPIPDTAYADAARLIEEGRAHILGLQGQLWGETLKGQERMEYMAVPPLLSLAERAWAPQPGWATTGDEAERERRLDAAWSAFAHRLGRRELPRLDAFHGGIGYRLPPPGAAREDGMLKANVAFPGLTIRYTTDGTTPTAQSPRYTEPVAVEEGTTVRLRTFSTRGRGSRVVTIIP